MNERRRFPRRSVDDASLAFSASLGLKVLDISTSGALLESPTPVRAGARGKLRVNLGGTPITLDVEVNRVEQEKSGTGCRLAARFLTPDPDQQHLIDRFVTP